jgi:ferredoxin-NADP reductase
MTENHIVTIQDITPVTHDVLKVTVEKPDRYEFTPGQATEVAINKPGWTEERRPFTFTSLPADNHLEFTIKTYPVRDGVTNQLLSLRPGDELILHDVWGAISYKGEGLFIAGGAGVTPFLSILRSLAVTNSIGANRLVFANKTRADIIHQDELQNMLNNAFINVLSDESVEGYEHGFITEAILRQNLTPTSHIYLCGPPPMMDAIQSMLGNIGVASDMVVVEI